MYWVQFTLSYVRNVTFGGFKKITNTTVNSVRDDERKIYIRMETEVIEIPSFDF